MGVVEALRAAVHRDPRRAATDALEIIAAARGAGDHAQLSRALSVLGRARLALGEVDLAEADLRGAIDAGHAAPDTELVADGHLGLAAVLSQAGRSAQAFDHLDTAGRLGSAQLQAYALLQRAVVQRRLGLLHEALASFDSALPTLRRLDARVDIAKVLLNRGVIRIHLGDCDGAIRDMAESRALYDVAGDEFALAQTRHGLGWAHARRGDLPRALQHLDAASEMFARHGHDALEVDVDRIEVLLSAGLYAAADELAGPTAERLHAGGDHSTAAEVWLLRSQSALWDGDRAAAARYAGRAQALYAGQGATGWQLVARLHVLRCTDGHRDELITLAGALEAAGNALGAATALGLAATAACRAGAVDEGAGLAARCTRRAARLGVFEVRMQSAHARATCAAARGNVSAARRQVRSALRDLERHRTSLAASDARAAVAVHAGELTQLGLRLAAGTGSAPTLLRWIELARAGRGRQSGPRPPADPLLAAELAELRSVLSRLRPPDGDPVDTGALLSRQRDLERAIHRRQLRTDSDATATRPVAASVTALRAALAGGVLVELAAIDGRMTAVVVDAEPARVVDVGPAEQVYAVAETLHSALCAAVARSRRGRAPPAALRRCLLELDSVLRPVAPGTGAVVLVVPPAFHTVPWNLVPCLTGRGVSVAPSATWWLSAQDHDPAPSAGPAVLVAGPRLVEAESEVREIAAHYPGAAVLGGPAATIDAALAALGAAPVAHLACHGRVRYDNPLWSALELADGPLHVYDLEALQRTPGFVVLSGCETGRPRGGSAPGPVGGAARTRNPPGGRR